MVHARYRYFKRIDLAMLIEATELNKSPPSGGRAKGVETRHRV